MAVAMFWGLCYGRCHVLRVVIAVAIFLAVIPKEELYCALVKFDVCDLLVSAFPDRYVRDDLKL